MQIVVTIWALLRRPAIPHSLELQNGESSLNRRLRFDGQRFQGRRMWQISLQDFSERPSLQISGNTAIVRRLVVSAVSAEVIDSLLP
jgi:hypothetical protein